MPMQLTITRNRKTSANFNSEGFGVSFTVEVDQSLLNRPDELQAKISELYREADGALDHQVGAQPARQSQQQARTDRNRGNGHAAPANIGNIRRPTQGNGGNGAHMTTAQRRAIDTISQRLNVDAAAECHAVFGLELEQLTVRDASSLIDHLKGLEQPARQNGGGR